MQQMKDNAGKISMVAVILVAAAAFYFMTRGDNSGARPSKVQFIDVSTGEIVWLKRVTRSSFPTTNPETGQDTLMPFYEDEDGVKKISRRYQREMQRLAREGVNKIVDAETMVVRAVP